MQKEITILDWLISQFPSAKKTTLRDMIERKRVSINGTPAKSLKQVISPEDKIALAEESLHTGQIAEGIHIVHNDAEILVIDKPAGLLTSTHASEPRPTVLAILNDYVQAKNQKAQALLIHRLDRDASGLLVFAKNQRAFENLKAQFAAHTVTRQYTAVVHGNFRKPTGRLENLLYEDERGLVHVTKQNARAKPAIMEYLVLAVAGNLTLVRCTLFTGRKHQIRVQLKSIGHPICGDVVYGTPEARENREPPFRLALHATHLALTHPKTKKRLFFDSRAPGSFSKLVPL